MDNFMESQEYHEDLKIQHDLLMLRNAISMQEYWALRMKLFEELAISLPYAADQVEYFGAMAQEISARLNIKYHFTCAKRGKEVEAFRLHLGMIKDEDIATLRCGDCMIHKGE